MELIVRAFRTHPRVSEEIGADIRGSEKGKARTFVG
jgi:hypothetical protein